MLKALEVYALLGVGVFSLTLLTIGILTRSVLVTIAGTVCGLTYAYALVQLANW